MTTVAVLVLIVVILSVAAFGFVWVSVLAINEQKRTITYLQERIDGYENILFDKSLSPSGKVKKMLSFYDSIPF